MKRLEHDLQVRFFRVVRIASNRDARLKAIYATPNASKRDYKHAASLKAEGLTKGVLDVCVPLKGKNGEPGMYIEMKIKGNYLSPEQIEFWNMVESQGYVCRLCYSTEEAVCAVESYLGISIMVHQKSQRSI